MLEDKNISLIKIISSIIEDGNSSKYINNFIEICHRISRETLLKSRFKEFLLEKTGMTVDDIAYDSIGDIFREVDCKYIYIEHHFAGYDKLKEDEIKSKVYSMIVSRTTQHITEIRCDFGENYFSVKKAIKLHLNRHKDIYKYIIIDKNIYIYSCNEDEIKWRRNQVDEDCIIDYLNSVDHDKNMISGLVEFIFKSLNNQTKYCKIIEEVLLINSISNYFKARMSDFLNDFANVPYSYDRKEDEL